MKLPGLLVCVAACGSPEPLELDGYSVTESRLAFEHQVGTPCPQLLDDLGVTNTGAELFVFTVSVDDVEGLDLIDFGDADDAAPTSTGSVEFELDPGASVAIVPWFTCGRTTSFETTIRLTPEGRSPAAIPVTATIR